MTILTRTTLNILCQKIENLFNWMDNLWLKVENIVAKGEIACFEQFLLLSLYFQNTVCCRSVRKRLYEGNSLSNYVAGNVHRMTLFGPTCRCILTHLQQTPFENFVSENEIAQNQTHLQQTSFENIVSEKEIAQN